MERGEFRGSGGEDARRELRRKEERMLGKEGFREGRETGFAPSLSCSALGLQSVQTRQELEKLWQGC